VVKLKQLNIKIIMEKYNKQVVIAYTATGKPYYAEINEDYNSFIYNQFKTGQIDYESYVKLKNNYYGY
jgi:hypothetical protein